MVNSPSVSRGTTSRTPTVSLSRDFCEVVRLLKMKPSLYQDDLNIEPKILWIHTPYKADFWCFRVSGANIVILVLLSKFLLAFPFSLLISQGHFCMAMWRFSSIETDKYERQQSIIKPGIFCGENDKK